MDFDKASTYCWLNGEMIKWNEATLSPINQGLHYGSCVFEGERAYNGKIFKSTEHSERLIASGKMLDFDIPYSVEDINKIKEDVIAQNGFQDCYIRAFAWVGDNEVGLMTKGNNVGVGVFAFPWGSYFSSDIKGLRFTVSDWRRPDPRTAPFAAKAAGLYMICSISKNNATRDGYDDALMLDYRGYIAEATAANIFFWMNDGKLHTPKPDCFLNGITRQTVIEIAKREGIEVIERHMELDELKDVKECFVTGSAAEVAPVSEIADYHFEPGDVCKKFMTLYAEEVRK